MDIFWLYTAMYIVIFSYRKKQGFIYSGMEYHSGIAFLHGKSILFFKQYKF